MQHDAARSGVGLRGAHTAITRGAFPHYGSFGLALILVAWAISWEQVQPLAQFYFFPIWFGYILAVDGAVAARRGTSLVKQGILPFIGLFVMSLAFWWGFEGLNIPVQNWHYRGADGYSRLGFFLSASLSFSTVVPAVLETATLVASFIAPSRYLSFARPPAPVRRLRIIVAVGVAALIAPWIWPRYTYPLLWVSALLLIEPANWLLGRPSIMRQLAAGRVILLFTLFAAGIICGIFWEMWNFYSMPKWYYVLPGIEAPKVFEMPLPGYLGYLPFALELYAMYNLILWLFRAESRFERVLQVPSPTR